MKSSSLSHHMSLRQVPPTATTTRRIRKRKSKRIGKSLKNLPVHPPLWTKFSSIQTLRTQSNHLKMNRSLKSFNKTSCRYRTSINASFQKRQVKELTSNLQTLRRGWALRPQAAKSGMNSFPRLESLNTMRVQTLSWIKTHSLRIQICKMNEHRNNLLMYRSSRLMLSWKLVLPNYIESAT